MTTAPGPGQKPDNPPTPPQSTLPNQYAFLWLSAAIFLMVLWMQGDNQARQQDLAYSDFKAAVVKQQVAEVTLKAEEILGKFTEAGAAAFSGDRSDARPATGFRTIRPPMDDPELLPLLEDHGITIRAAPAGLPWWQQLIQAFLPWLLLLALMFWFWNTAQRRMARGAACSITPVPGPAGPARKHPTRHWMTWPASSPPSVKSLKSLNS